VAAPPHIDKRHLWRSLSLVALGRLLVGVFFIFATLGFVIDIFDPRSTSFAWVLMWCAYSGAVAVLYVLAIAPGPKMFVPVMIGQIVSTVLLSRVVPHGESLIAAGGPPLQHRLTLDGVGVLITVIAAWVWVASFVNRQALDLVLATFELTIAQGLQADLVPTVSLATPRVTTAGQSIPSSQMGGDVVDAVGLSDEVVGYVADVSGHGIAAGVLMAVVKSAVRMHLLTSRSLSALLADLNTVLPALKDAARYATLAAVRVRSDGSVDYALAGHLPILHFRRRTRSIAQLTTPQLALGMFPDAEYVSGTTTAEPGDLLVLVTDGLTEVVNRADEEFGLERIGDTVIANADRPPSDIVAALLAAVRRHGPQADDQSVLVLRIGGHHGA